MGWTTGLAHFPNFSEFLVVDSSGTRAQIWCLGFAAVSAFETEIE